MNPSDTTATAPRAIISLTHTNHSTRQRDLDKWLSSQPSSTPILRINCHQALTPHQLKRWSLQNVTTLPMSLEQQLQTILNHLTTHHFHRILIIESAEQLPLSTLTALSHLDHQQTTLSRPLLQIVLCGTQELTQHIDGITLKKSSTSPDTTNVTLTETSRLAHPQETPYRSSSKQHATFLNQHSVKMISFALLGILIYIIWQLQHHPKHTFNTQPLIPNQQLIHPVNAHSQPTPKHTPEQKAQAPQPPIKNKAITQTTHYTLQWTSSHDSAATKVLQKKLSLPHSRILKVIQNKQIRFILVSGDYKNTHQAKQALHALPASIQAQQPWIRPMISP